MTARSIVVRTATALAVVSLFAVPAWAADASFPLGSRIGLVAPGAMTPSKTLRGFEDRDTKASMLILEIPPQASAEVEKQMTPAALTSQGMTEEQRETVTLKSGTGLLIVGEQVADNKKVRKWILLASTPEASALIAAQVPEDAAAKYPDADMQDDQYAAQLKAIDSTRDQQYQNVLGTNGVAMLERQQDYNFQTLKRYETVWQLTDAEVDHVYAALRDYRKTVDDYQQRAQALEDNGQEVDWPAVDTNIQQFGRQVAQGLQLYLGNDRFQKIRRNEIFAFSPPEVASH